MAEIAELVKLWQDRRRPSSSVKQVAAAHLAELDRKIKEMESMRKTLGHLIHCCQGATGPIARSWKTWGESMRETVDLAPVSRLTVESFSSIPRIP